MTLQVAVAYFLIYVVWGSTYYFIGVCLRDIPPFLLGTLRFSLAGGLLLMLCMMRGERVLSRRLVMRSAVSGIVLLFVDQAVIMLAQRYVSSSLVAIVASSTALWIMLLDYREWRHNFRRRITVAGMLLGFAGVAMLYAEQLGQGQSFGDDGVCGVLLLVGGCVSWACGTLYSKYRASAVESVNGFAGSAWQMLWASFVFVLCAVFEGVSVRPVVSEVRVSSWLSLVYLVVFGSLLAYSAYVWLLKVRPAAEVATHAYVNPIVAVVLGTGLGDEHVTALQCAGLVVILAGVALVGTRKGRTMTGRREVAGQENALHGKGLNEEKD